MTQPPTGRPDFQPGSRPDFTPAAPAASSPQYQTGFAPQDQFGGQRPPQRADFQPEPSKPAQGGGRTPLLVGGIGILVVALLVIGWAFVFGPLSGEQPGSGASEPPAVTGEGTLPQAPKLKAPAVIDEVAAAAGLVCHDEATTGSKVRGCYLNRAQDSTVLRFLLTEEGQIESLTAAVLEVDAAAGADSRAAKLLALVNPLLADLPLTDADRRAVADAVKATTGTEAEVDGQTAWGDADGSFSYSYNGSLSTLSLGRHSTTVLAPVPLSDSPDAVLAVLEERGWKCERDDYTYDCFGQGIGNIAGSIAELEDGSKELTSFRVWFDARPPAPTEPLMLDAYHALAAAGQKGEALGIGLRMLAEGEEQFFNSDAEFYRGDSYYEIKGVVFN